MEKSNYTRLPVFALRVSKNCVLFVFCRRQRRWCIFFFTCGKSRLVHRSKKNTKKERANPKKGFTPFVLWASSVGGKKNGKEAPKVFLFSLPFSFYVPFQPLSNNGWYCCTHKKYTPAPHKFCFGFLLPRERVKEIQSNFPGKKRTKEILLRRHESNDADEEEKKYVGQQCSMYIVRKLWKRKKRKRSVQLADWRGYSHILCFSPLPLEKGGGIHLLSNLKKKYKLFHTQDCFSFLSSLATIHMRANGESLPRPFLFEDKLEPLWNNWPRECAREIVVWQQFPHTLLSPTPKPRAIFLAFKRFFGAFEPSSAMQSAISLLTSSSSSSSSSSFSHVPFAIAVH